MGTKYDPPCAYIFLGIFEETHIYPLIKETVKLFLTYIDNKFLIQTGSENDLQQLICKFNQVHLSIKYDFNYSKNQINFLETTIKKSAKGKLLTTLYGKVIHRQSDLYRKFHHPESLKRSIPFLQVLQLKQIWTTQEDFKEQS